MILKWHINVAGMWRKNNIDESSQRIPQKFHNLPDVLILPFIAQYILSHTIVCVHLSHINHNLKICIILQSLLILFICSWHKNETLINGYSERIIQKNCSFRDVANFNLSHTYTLYIFKVPNTIRIIFSDNYHASFNV